MDTALLYFVVILALAGLLLLARRMLKVYLRYKGKGVVICPETRECVAIKVDARHAAWATVDGTVDLRLKDCSRWPERANCGQECVAQIERAPEHCLVQTMLKDWFRGKACVYCGEPFGEINWTEHKPALLNLAHQTVEWDEIPPAELYDALTTHLPVCWNCHIAETFRRERPELVVERPWKTGVHV
jgi:hypothetical protein